MAKKNLKLSSKDKIYYAVVHILLTIFLIIIVYPLVFILSASISDAQAVAAGKVWLWPVGFSLQGYKVVFEHRLITSGFLNSIFYMTTGTAINVCMTLLAGYALSRKELVFRRFYTFLFLFTMLFNGGLIPTYLLVKDLGMMGTRWAMIIPNALAVWNLIVTRTYFETTIPTSLLEASKLEGCNDFLYFWKIVIPLSGPIIAVQALFYAVGHWNSFFNALIYLSDSTKFPLQLILRDILLQNQMDKASLSSVEDMLMKQNLEQLLKYSLIVVASGPVLIIYPFVQKYFVKGIMIGSVKG